MMNRCSNCILPKLSPATNQEGVQIEEFGLPEGWTGVEDQVFEDHCAACRALSNLHKQKVMDEDKEYRVYPKLSKG